MSMTAQDFAAIWPCPLLRSRRACAEQATPHVATLKKEIINLIYQIMDAAAPDWARFELAKIYDAKLTELYRIDPGVKFDLQSTNDTLTIV